jgi:hypothetical protein
LIELPVLHNMRVGTEEALGLRVGLALMEGASDQSAPALLLFQSFE